MTLNQTIKNLLQPIAEDHLILNGFGFGSIHNFATGSAVKYPFMFVVLNNVRHSEKAYHYSFSLIFSDIAKDDDSNALEIQSDMIQVAADVAVKLRDLEDDYVSVSNEFNFKPFTERFTDYCSGVVMDITISTLHALSDCDFPSRFNLTDGKLLTETGGAIKTEDDGFITL